MKEEKYGQKYAYVYYIYIFLLSPSYLNMSLQIGEQLLKRNGKFFTPNNFTTGIIILKPGPNIA